MKILIDGRLYGLEHAGIGRYIMNLIGNLQNEDLDNEYVLLLSEKYFPELKLPSNWKKVSVKIPHYTLTEQLKIPQVISMERPDLVHFPHFNVPVFYQGKYVVTIHDLIKHGSRGTKTTTSQPWFYWLKYLGYKIVFRQAVKRAAKILVPSQTIKEELARTYGLPERKIAVTYEGVDKKFQISNFKFQISDEVLNKYKIKKPFIIYTGSLYPHKNVERLVEVVKCSNDLYHDSSKLSLVIVCARSVFYERFKRKIEQMKAENDVKMIGFVSDPDLARLYQEAEAFVFPSLSEGFGLPGLEAMACGTPVICSDIPVFREVYGEAAIYFDPYNPADITRKIELVLKDEELRRKLKKLGSELVEGYSWGKMAKETLAVYEVCFSIKEDHQEKER